MLKILKPIKKKKVKRELKVLMVGPDILSSERRLMSAEGRTCKEERTLSDYSTSFVIPKYVLRLPHDSLLILN